MADSYVVALYEIDRAYGGPEEGGWWYNCGTLERTVKVFHNADKAWQFTRRMNHWLERLNKHNRADVYSIAYRGGAYEAICNTHVAPAHFPESRPYYE